MKLQLEIAPWRELLSVINAQPSAWHFSGDPRSGPPAWVVELETTGLEVKIDELDFDDKRLFSYRGRRVLIYIKDTFRTQYELIHERPIKFHLRKCHHIDEMEKKGRLKRYVATANETGLFPVFSLEKDKDKTHLSFDARLLPCRWCLGELNYLGYKDKDTRAQNDICKTFEIPAFFAQYPSTIAITLDNEGTRPNPDDYPHDWREISLRAREEASWKCLECSVNLVGDHDLLETHHINGIKSDCDMANLRPLCLECHGRQPLHNWKAVDPARLQRLRRVKRAQRLGS